MKKTMLLAAAALMSMCGGAMAGGSGSVTVQLSNYCDEYTLSYVGPLYAIASDSTTCDPGIGGGTAGKVKKMGNLVTTGMILNSDVSEQYVWTFSNLKKGGTASLYDTTDGVTLNFITSSPFTIVTGASHKNANLPPATQAARN